MANNEGGARENESSGIANSDSKSTRIRVETHAWLAIPRAELRE